MRLASFMMPLHPPGKNYIQSLREDREAIILADQLGCSEADVTIDKNIYSDLGGDSLDTVELVMALEEEYNIEITSEQGEKFQTVADIVDYLFLHASES